MFRALCTLFTLGQSEAIMQPPLSAKLIDGEENAKDPVTLSLTQANLFSTTVGSSSKKTLAQWHVTSPEEVVDAMLRLVGLPTPKRHEDSMANTPVVKAGGLQPLTTHL
jgi:trehalose 6-phosphate synthase/phosphatase